MARLDEIFNLQMGKTPSRNNIAYWTEGQYDWVSIADLGTYQKYVKTTKEKISALAVKESGIKCVPANTVIMSFKLSLGKTAITQEPIYTNEAIMAFIPTGKYPVLPDYFYHLFSSIDWSKGTNRAVMGTTLNKAMLGAISIPIPPLAEQRKIAAVLDKVSDLIAKRRQQLDKLDELVKSRFIELFGMCETYELLQDSNIYISDGNYSSKYPTADEFVEEGIPFIRASNMEMNTIIDSNMYFITKEKHAILAKGHVKADDVLITTRGATIGKIACVPPRHEDSNINAQIVLLRCPKNEYNPLFLSWYLKLDNTQAEIQKLISGSAQPQLPIKRLVQLNLLKPNIDLQNQFAAFSKQTDKLKLPIQKSLEKLETLKKVLMQEYFE